MLIARFSRQRLLIVLAGIKTFAARAVMWCALPSYHELEHGIPVVDSVGNVVGHSVLAARRALRETCVTRVVLPAGNFVVVSLLECDTFLQFHSIFSHVLPACL
jgi:hypothetical protein